MNTLKTLLAVAVLRSVFALVDWALSRVSAQSVSSEPDELATA